MWIESKKSRVLRELKNLLKEVGYGLTETVLNASRCGVPQDRRRFFLVGELNGLNDTLLPYYKKNMTKRPITLHDYFGNSLGTEFYYRHPRSYARRAVFSIYEPSPTIRGVNRPVPKTYKAHPNDASSDIASLRPLTTKERSYIQTFPQDFIFEGAKTDLEQMIGNAVPVKLADFVGNCLLEYISKQHEQVTRENEVLQLPLL